ncbi:hypothetical protein AURDEDRAFT_177144 [Auricularia subglabra TFB-10046 SS5]|uniref:Uncharacterized protein n=1 Tax=Auricularia subglabra (strain TFB-10046 / SS5) TaxID=717982 RepID=J0CTX3_AURST|nr:hypothetical protein AURDEDRAFT_177144 [Auricularia subglabra TFB-10046 SS5]
MSAKEIPDPVSLNELASLPGIIAIHAEVIERTTEWRSQALAVPFDNGVSVASFPHDDDQSWLKTLASKLSTSRDSLSDPEAVSLCDQTLVMIKSESIFLHRRRLVWESVRQKAMALSGDSPTYEGELSYPCMQWPNPVIAAISIFLWTLESIFGTPRRELSFILTFLHILVATITDVPTPIPPEITHIKAYFKDLPVDPASLLNKPVPHVGVLRRR